MIITAKVAISEDKIISISSSDPPAVPITAKVVADMMETVGISRLITVDLHAEQIQGFYYRPVDNIYGTPVMFDDIKIFIF